MFSTTRKTIVLLMIHISAVVMANLNLIFVNYEYSKWLTLLACWVIAFIIITAIHLKNSEIDFLAPASLFIMFCYLFHFGQVFINVFFKDYTFFTINFILGNEEIAKESLIFCLNTIEILSISICFFYKQNKKNSLGNNNKENEYKYNDKYLKMTAFVICLFSLPLKIMMIISSISIMKSSSYYYSLDAGYSGVLVQISSFYIIGFCLLLIINSENIKKAKMIFSLEVLFCGFTMLSGQRIQAIITICVLVYLFHKTVMPIEKKKVIPFGVLAVLLLQIITAVSHLRAEGNFSIEDIVIYVATQWRSLIPSILDEFGGTYFTVKEAFVEIPAEIHYHFGLSYLKAMATVGLNFGGILTNYTTEIEFTKLFSYPMSYGGSVVGELWYNFGYFSYIVGGFIGYIIAKFSFKFDYYLREKKYMTIVYYVMPSFALLSWVRGYADGFARNIVWGAIYIFILGRIVELFVRKYTRDN